MTRRQRTAVAVLFCLIFALTGAGYFGLVRQSDSLVRQSDSERAAQQQAGRAVEAKLCTTFSKLAELQPPPGDPSANPSRAYLQGQHAVLVELGTDLGCRG